MSHLYASTTGSGADSMIGTADWGGGGTSAGFGDQRAHPVRAAGPLSVPWPAYLINYFVASGSVSAAGS